MLVKVVIMLVVLVVVKFVIMLSAGGQGGNGGQGRGHVGGPGGGQDGGQCGGLSIMCSQVKRKKNEPDKDAPSSLYILSATNPIRFMVALPKQC